jgi:ribosomal protein L37AE/L43A
MLDIQCKCGNTINHKRIEAGYFYCMECGERKAKEARMGWCIAPLNKSNYILITDPADLKMLNPKRTPT